MAALRSRHAFLMKFAGIVRYESLHERNLSDLYSFTWKADKDIHRFLVTMFQLPSGKLVVGCVLWFLFSLFSNPFHPFVLHAQVRPIMVYIFLGEPSGSKMCYCALLVHWPCTSYIVLVLCTRWTPPTSPTTLHGMT